MELLDRYLHAVKFWLPKGQQDDIIAELSEDLHSQVEDREQQLGRKLNDNEVAEMLRQRGRPFLVANRYQPQHSLIGPALFPIYLLVLKIAAACFLVPRFLVIIGFFIFDPKYRVQGIGTMMSATWSGLWSGAFFAFGIVTLIFAILEQTQQKSHWLEKWDPLKLPKVKDTRRIPRASSIFEVVIGTVAVMWLAEFATSGILLNQPNIRIELTTIGRQFVWVVTAMSLFGVVMSAINMFRPFWTRRRLALRVVQDALSTLVLALAARAGALIILSGASITANNPAAINAAVNTWIALFAGITAAICAVVMIVDLVRLITLKANQPPLLKQVSGTASRLSC